MLDRSARFDATVAGSHRIATTCDVLYAGKVIATGLPISAGSVTASRGQFARRTCSVMIGGAQWVPTGSTADVLTTFGTEIRLGRGVTYADGQVEVLPQGVFGIYEIDIDDPAGSVQISGFDRGRAVSDARFTSPRTILGGLSLVTTIRTLIAEAAPYASFRVHPAIVDIPMQQATYDQARDGTVTDLAAVVGGEVFFDPRGDCILQPVPDPNTNPVFTVQAGPGGVLVTSTRRTSREGVYNGVVATGASAGNGTAPSALVVDTDPNSATYWSGPYGQVPAFLTSTQLTNQAQCIVAASAVLRNQLGAARSVDFTAVPNTALEPGDSVQTIFSDRLKQNHLIDSITIGLTAADAMQASTRATAFQAGLS